MKNRSEDFKEFKSVILIYPKDRRLSRFFNDRASHTNKTGKSNNNNNNNNINNKNNVNNNNVSASRKHSLCETNVEQKINVPGNSNGPNFKNTLMPLNNIYKFDAHSWPKSKI